MAIPKGTAGIRENTVITKGTVGIRTNTGMAAAIGRNKAITNVTTAPVAFPATIPLREGATLRTTLGPRLFGADTGAFKVNRNCFLLMCLEEGRTPENGFLSGL